jgi:hypothetical protein
MQTNSELKANIQSHIRLWDIASKKDIANSLEKPQDLTKQALTQLVNEVWEHEKPNFCKLYKHRGEIFAAFTYDKLKNGDILCYALMGEHFEVNPNFLRGLKRINKDAPEALQLVNYLMGNYWKNYHCAKPILL